MGEKPVVNIRVPGSHGKTWNRTEEAEAARLMADLLERAGFEGEFEAILGRALPGSERGVRVKRHKGYGVHLVVQPESSDSRREVFLQAQQGLTGEAFMARLRAVPSSLAVEEPEGAEDEGDEDLPPPPEEVAAPPAASPPPSVPETEEQRLEREFFDFDKQADALQEKIDDARRRLPGAERELRTIEDKTLPDLARELQEIQLRAAAIAQENVELERRRASLTLSCSDLRKVVDQEGEVKRLRGERDRCSTQLEELKRERKISAGIALIGAMREQLKGLGLSELEIEEALRRGGIILPTPPQP